MSTTITILSALLIVMSIFLVVAVLMQSGKDSRLSGTIAGGAETFFGKTKGKTIDRVLSKATTIVAIVFVVLVFAVPGLLLSTGVSRPPLLSALCLEKKSLCTGEENPATPLPWPLRACSA